MIAASNRPNAIDPALHRRLPRQVEVPLPKSEEREEILAVLLSGDPCVNWSKINLRAFASSSPSLHFAPPVSVIPSLSLSLSLSLVHQTNQTNHIFHGVMGSDDCEQDRGLLWF